MRGPSRRRRTHPVGRKAQPVAVIFVLLTLVGAAGAQNAGSGLAEAPWAKFRHDSANTGLSPYVAAGSATLKWKYQAGREVICSPALAADGTVYFAVLDRFIALTAGGEVKWQYLTGLQGSSSPAIAADGTIYIGTALNRVVAIPPIPEGAPAAGGEGLGDLPLMSFKWRYDTDDDVDGPPAIGPDGTIYVGCDDGCLYAINADGSLKWKLETGDEIATCPAVGADGTIYVCTSDFGSPLYAVNPDGSIKWESDPALLFNHSPAIAQDGTIVAASSWGQLVAFDPDGQMKWQHDFGEQAGVPSCAPAIGPGGTVYVGCDDGRLCRFTPDGRQVEWQYATGGEIRSCPAVDAEGTVYVGSLDRYLYAIRADGSLKWRYETGGPVRSSPAIGADGTIHVGSDDGCLYAIGL